MKKIILFILTFLFTLPLYASDISSTNFAYFGNDTCLDCLKTRKYISELKKEKPFINYDFHNNLEDKDLLYQYYETYNVPKEDYNVIPIIFINNSYYIGYDNISSYLSTANEEDFKQPLVLNESLNQNNDINVDVFKSFSFLNILGAGLLDGINPCSIAMLLFLISLLSMNDKSKTQILFIGLSYVLGVFVSYLCIGLGAYKFITFLNLNWLRVTFIIITIGLSLFLSVLSFRDFILIKQNKYNQVKTQLPKFLKHRIHNVLRENSKHKYLIITTFFIGIVISLLEFFCTGQIYLPTISYMLSNPDLSNRAFIYLIIYNMAFVLPLIIICFSMYLGKNVMDISQTLVSKLHLIKLISSVFFIIMTIILIKQLLWII